jgi:sugar lactone lactonase YvrE
MSCVSRSMRFLIVLALSVIGISLAGCGGSLPSNAPAGIQTQAAPPLAAGGATSLYVIQQPTSGAASILQFSATANGSVAPLSTLTLPAGLTPLFVTTDTLGKIYVGTTPAAGGAGQILVYAAGASGTATPLQTILGSATLGQGTFVSPNFLAVDSAGLLYVTDATSISVFASGANGPATPIRQIVGALTQLTTGATYAGAIVADRSGYIYVGNNVFYFGANGEGILVFSPGATGNVAPARVLNTEATVGTAFGLDVDATGNLYVTAGGSISVFAPGATGNDQPVRMIDYPWFLSTPSYSLDSIRVDAAGNIYTSGTANLTAAALTVPVIASFGAGAVSSSFYTQLTPTTTITSSAWTGGSSGLGLK